MFDAETNEISPFGEFMGSHGGMGGWQSQPFALIPAEWSEERKPIVGSVAMHGALRDWIAEAGQQLRPHRDAEPPMRSRHVATVHRIRPPGRLVVDEHVMVGEPW